MRVHNPHPADHQGYTCGAHSFYGMDCAEFEALRARAAGRCELCSLPEEETPLRKLCVDHAHEYGPTAVRGLVCSRCNSVLGVAESRMTPVQRGAAKNADGERWIANYLRRAWFVQITEWARASDGLLGFSDFPDQRYREVMLRRRVTARLREDLGVEPTVTLRCTVQPKTVTVHLVAEFVTADGYTVTATIERRPAQAYGTERIRIIGPGLNDSQLYFGAAPVRRALARARAAVAR
jgi:hypothetical protein